MRCQEGSKNYLVWNDDRSSMMSAENSTYLQVPARRNPYKGSRDARPSKVEQWLNDLPLANLSETAQQVYQALTDFNGLHMAVHDRLKLMELFRAPVLYIGDALKKHYIGQPLPLPDKSRRIAELARVILTQMIIGYKIVMAEVLAGRTTHLDVKARLTAAHRTLSYLGHLLTHAYRVYGPQPSGIWREMHQLYLYAEQSDLHETAVADAEYSLITAATVGEVYRKILLLTLASPYRLRPGEVDLVYAALERWTPYSVLSDARGPDPSRWLFVTDLDQDKPPTYLALHGHKDLLSCRLLDTQNLTSLLREQLAQTRATRARYWQNADTPPPQDVLRRLMLAWGVIPKRRFARSKKSSQVMVTVGLSAAHYFISQRTPDATAAPHGARNTPPIEPVFTRRAHFGSQPLGASPDVPAFAQAEPTDLYWKMQARAEQKTAPKTDPAQEYRYQTWVMEDVGVGGYRLRWDSVEPTSARVGEVIAAQELEEVQVHQWAIGVIRWIKCSGTRLEVGIQILAPSAEALGTLNTKADTQHGSYQRSLLLPQIRAIQQPATLLLPALVNQVGDTIIINSDGKEQRVQLTKLLEDTGAVAQFHFTLVDDETKKSARSSEDNKEFDSIWSAL